MCVPEWIGRRQTHQCLLHPVQRRESCAWRNGVVVFFWSFRGSVQAKVTRGHSPLECFEEINYCNIVFLEVDLGEVTFNILGGSSWLLGHLSFRLTSSGTGASRTDGWPSRKEKEIPCPRCHAHPSVHTTYTLQFAITTWALRYIELCRKLSFLQTSNEHNLSSGLWHLL